MVLEELVVQEVQADLLAAVAAEVVDTLPLVKASEISTAVAVAVELVHQLVPERRLEDLLVRHTLAAQVEPAQLLVLQQRLELLAVVALVAL